MAKRFKNHPRRPVRWAAAPLALAAAFLFLLARSPVRGEEPAPLPSPAPALSLAEASSAAPVAESAAPAETSLPDDPLLVLVNSENPLPESWRGELVPVAGDSEEQVDARALGPLWEMLEAAREEDVWFWVASGYRSQEEQAAILQRRVDEGLAEGLSQSQAEAQALGTIARPGHSEHQTGLAVDFNDASPGFAETAAYRWLQEHGAEYGFVQRYRAEKADVTGIQEESWHYRYVGRAHAQAMEAAGLCLEEYVLSLQGNGG